MNKYIVNNSIGNIDIIKGDGLDHNEKTGQTIIYRQADACSVREVVAVVAPTSSIVLLEPKNNETAGAK